MITENLSTLKLHKLTQAQYERELEAGRIDESALYLTPDVYVDYPTNSQEYPGCYYRTIDDEIEWLNPPMELETEYRTSERFDGKPVYTQSVIFESLSFETTDGEYTELGTPVYVARKDIIPANAKIIELVGTIENLAGTISMYSFTMPFTIGGKCIAWLKVDGSFHINLPDVYPNYALCVVATEALENYRVCCKIKYVKL